MAQQLALARAKVTRGDVIVHEQVQVVVRKGTMRISGGGFRGDIEGVTSLVQSSPSVWTATFESGDELTVQRDGRKCGSCGGRR